MINTDPRNPHIGQTPDPETSILSLPGLAATAEIRRDQWGIPHVRAASAADLYLVNGHVHAQDRMWQMEAALRRGIGRLAEWTGPAALPADRLARQLGAEAAARRDFDALAPATQEMLARYAQGVNAWIDSGGTAPEYDLLGSLPMRWEPWFGVAVMRQRGILMGSVWFKLWRAAALGTIGAEAVPLLRYDDGADASGELVIAPQGADTHRLAATLEQLAPAIEALSGFAPEDGTVGGSNNWAVAGSRTASGLPLLAGDPHRQYEIPGIYTQLHLSCPDFDAIGFSVPGVPAFPHFCHTENVAWCVTHSFADLHDLYVEEFSDGGARYRTETGTEATTTRQEVIAVRGAPDETITVHETRHGPIIAGDPASGPALALKSAQLFDIDRSLDCLEPMMRATSLDAFYKTCKGWGVIDHNVVGADRDGHIGVLIRASVPERDRINGWLPVPGWTGTHEWRGYIPFDRMPCEIDPAQGYIVTANNRTVPEDHPDYITTDCHPTTRASRLAHRIARTSDLTPGDMTDFLRDTDSAPAREITARILAAWPAGTGGNEGEEASGSPLRAALAGWDGRMDTGLTAPTIYYMIRQEMTRELVRLSGLDRASDHPAAAPAPGIPALNQMWWTLPRLLRDDDVTLLDGNDWTGVIRRAIASVSAGPLPEPWGAAHVPLFVHPLAHVFPDATGVAPPTSDPTGGDGDCVLATGGFPGYGTRSVYGPVARYVFDLADWDNSRWIVMHGAAGQAGDSHYSDQNPLWARGEMVPMAYSAEAVAGHTVKRTRLNPA
ncbi:penicillin acylase family protein [Pseudooceanicola aestuarii]|uniref:penicillin acylase family protein n=1 Tax=Pseudooceanicola aestuarii TaxID=2697319 RepID=UPI0013CFD934|nr:penicillin acylase family protein [Pseudooceanicola aestuarii]